MKKLKKMSFVTRVMLFSLGVLLLVPDFVPEKAQAATVTPTTYETLGAPHFFDGGPIPMCNPNSSFCARFPDACKHGYCGPK